jgi:cytochrome bd-type quinol oxidase subunit 2
MKAIKKIALAAGSAATTLGLAASSAMAVDAIDTEIKAPTGFATDIGSLFNSLLNIVMLIAALLVFAYLIMGGIEWITSGGDKGKAESARNKLTSAVIGLIIVAASYAIFTLLLRFLGFGGDVNKLFQDIPTISSN